METTQQTRLAGFRSFYARLVTAAGGAGKDERLRDAFARVERERFCGPGPWRVFTQSTYIDTPANDPAFLYQDVVVALKGPVNNGQPSLHAACLHALRLKEGEHVLHIGSGTGYYTALLAHLVGTSGLVEAYELDEELGARAKENLAQLPQVQVHVTSGVEGPLPSSDVIYVNAGATHPLAIWLEALRPGGRLLFPLTPDEGFGGMLLLEPAVNFWQARFLWPVMFIGCTGARDAAMESKLAIAFKAGTMREVRSLRYDTKPDRSCWLAGEGWWLSTAPPS